jgi:hypothetical protein
MNVKYNHGSVFQGKVVNKKKTRKRQDEHFPKLPHVHQLIKIFENLHNDMRITEVWFLKKKDKGDGFEDFHYDYKNNGGESNCVSFTVNVNLGKLNGENDIATTNISLSNEEPSILSRPRGEEMMQKLSLQEKEEINWLPKEDLYCLKSGMLYTKRRQLLHGLPEGTRLNNVQENTWKKAIPVLQHSTIQITPNITKGIQGVLEGRTCST